MSFVEGAGVSDGPWPIIKCARCIGSVQLWNNGCTDECCPVKDDRLVVDLVCKQHAEMALLRQALQQMTDAYTALVHSGDCGHWNPELDPPVVDARILLPDPLAVTQQEKTP
jgi:hypothetical protein